MINQQFQLEASAECNIGNRMRQEDAFAFSCEEVLATKGLLAVLADGMGGMADGDKFSAIATNEMIRYFEEQPLEEDLCQTLLNCYAAAQQKALEAQNPDGDDGGSTVTAVLLRGNQCAFLSSGDSRIYLLRGGGLVQLNREQIMGTVLDERAALGIISREEAELNIMRKALINHLGSSGNIPCDVCARPFTLAAGDRLALMSDGVFGTLDDDELTKLLAQPVQEASKAVVKAVLARKKPRQDNCSIVLIGVEPETSDE